MADRTAPTAPAAAAVAVPTEELQRSRKDTGGRDLHRHLEISDGRGVVASADVTISRESDGPARASLRVVAGHLAPGVRAHLVDAVLNLPELHDGARLQAAFPLGDSETLFRFQERCTDVTTHPAGATVLLEATIWPGQTRWADAPGMGTREAAQRWADAWERRWRAEEESAECRVGTPIVDGDQAAVPWSARTRLAGGGTEHLAGVSLLRFSDDGQVMEERDFWNQG